MDIFGHPSRQITIHPLSNVRNVLYPTQPLERWQMERVTSILDPEYAHKEAVHSKHYTTPNKDS